MDYKDLIEHMFEHAPVSEISNRIANAEVTLKLTGAEYIALVVHVMDDSPVILLTTILLGRETMNGAATSLGDKLKAATAKLRADTIKKEA